MPSNYSMAFNGVDQRFQLFDPDQIQNSISFSGWFKTSSFGTQTIVALDGGPVGKHAIYPWNIYLDEFGRLNFKLGHAVFAVSTVTSNQSGLNNGEWHHFACVYDGGLTRTPLYIYIDGIFDAIGTSFGVGIIQYTPPFGFSLAIGMIGQQHPITTFRWFSGLIDEIGIWDDYVLTAAEIAAIAAGGPNYDLTPLNPKYWWRMGEGATFTGSTWRVQSEVGSHVMVSENMVESDRKTDVPP